MENNIQANMMKEYLGNDYSENHLRNFCLYWMKESTESGDTSRAKNDLDCLYFDGDLNADTLMSTWTPIKWMILCLNRGKGLKPAKNTSFLKRLAEDRDYYLPPKHELVKLLDRFLELAELRCNYILLPDRKMNNERYRAHVNGKVKMLYDQVPPTLYYLFEKEQFGRFFPDGDAISWIRREKLECGFREGILDQAYVIPLLKRLKPGEAVWLSTEEDLKEGLNYMIHMLEARLRAI